MRLTVEKRIKKIFAQKKATIAKKEEFAVVTEKKFLNNSLQKKTFPLLSSLFLIPYKMPTFAKLHLKFLPGFLTCGVCGMDAV